MSTARKRKLDANKDEVIHIRTAPSDKSLIEKAANALGLTVSSFILENSLKAARYELAEIERIVLSKKEAALFASALLNPPEPNTALKAAFKKYDHIRK